VTCLTAACFCCLFQIYLAPKDPKDPKDPKEEAGAPTPESVVNVARAKAGPIATPEEQDKAASAGVTLSNPSIILVEWYDSPQAHSRHTRTTC
jgi:hypothetical protein